MTWRGSADVKDRIFASLPYLVPLFYSQQFGIFLLNQFPILNIIFIPVIPVAIVYRSIGGFAGLIIFFVLFLAVVRNERISHFIRFNTMQSILLGIALSLVGIVLNTVLLPIIGRGFLAETLYNVVFLGTIAACGYSMVQSWLGRYAEIPGISQSVYNQVR